MNSELHEDQLRVTSVPYDAPGLVIFSGIPLKKSSYITNSGKYYVTIKADPETLPVQPAIGQHWSVKGARVIKLMDTGDYVMQQHTFESPSRIECNLPESGEQLIQFIAKERDFRGIGESKARALWELLGKDFHSTLRHDVPESRERLRSVLNQDSLDALFAGYAKYKNLSASNWMTQHKIPAQVQQRLIKFHDEKSIESIKANPYLLIGFGMNFSAVDELASNKFNLTKESPERLASAVEISIRKEVEKGHTYTTQADIRPTLKKLLGSNDLATQALEAGCHKAQFIINIEAGTFHPTAQFLMESVVAKRLLTLVAKTNLLDDTSNMAFLDAVNELPYKLTQKQSDAVLTTLDNAVSCITGGAGTGKTTVLRTALRAYESLGFVIHAVALSGRAAMRLKESIGIETMTIAAFLRKDPVEPDLVQPNHLLMIDEGSMVDVPLMYRMVTHVTPSVRIVVTGDPDQLPPIGCGKVLADMVESKVIPNTTLDIVKRQEGSTGIPEYSKLVNAGIVPNQLTTGAITFHETRKESIAECCTQLFSESPKNSRIIGSTKIMVAEINNLTQKAVNPDGEKLEFKMNGEMYFLDMRQNDAILFTQNNYELGIQNGSLGILTSVEQKGESYGTVELDTGTKVEVTPAVLDCMQLGFCITLHKSQGSQFPRTIIALQKGRIVDRAWLYTAITRAEYEVHIVGTKADFKSITEAPSNSHKRNSYLVELLKSKIVLSSDMVAEA